jgi:hypothetical protein
MIQFDNAGNAICGSILRNGGANNGTPFYSVGIASDSSGQYTYMGGTFGDSLICGKSILIPLFAFEAPYVARWQPCPSSSLNISGSNDSTCKNTCDGIVKAFPNGGNPPYTYLWNNGETTQIDTGLCVGTYAVMVTDSAGNKITFSDTVFAKPVTAVTLTVQSSDTTCQNSGTITLFGSPAGGTYSGLGVHGKYFYPDSVPWDNEYLFTYSYTNSYGCTSSITDSLYVAFCSGITELTRDNGEWTIYPNPSNGMFTIVGTQNFVSSWSVEVYNVLGEKVYSAAPTDFPRRGSVSFSYEINLSSEPDGVYFYRVVAGDGGILGSGKVVKVSEE